MSAHSPGPWKWYKASGSMAGADGNAIVHDAFGMREADARLIAAAPEMLAMLDRIVNGETGIVMDEAEALIKRVKGEP